MVKIIKNTSEKNIFEKHLTGPIWNSSPVVSSLLKSMQELPIASIVQKEGGTQLKLIIDFQVHTAQAHH
jgi:hypothetical protein